MKEIIDWAFSGVWAKFILSMLMMGCLIALFGVPKYSPTKTAYACQGIAIPEKVSPIYQESYCMCMGKDKSRHDKDSEAICLARIEKIKENALIK